MLTTCNKDGGEKDTPRDTQSEIDETQRDSGDDSDEETVYIGKRDAQGRPHGRGTLTWPDSKTRFEGRFEAGTRHGRGRLYFADGGTVSGRFERDNLEGEGVYTYDDGGTMKAWYRNGELDGEFTEFDSDGQITAKGHHKKNKRSGHLWLFDDFGGTLVGVVDDDGAMTGNDITYIYPDGKHAFVGTFVNGQMLRAKPATLTSPVDSIPLLYDFNKAAIQISLGFDESSSDVISSKPLVVDLYEQERVYVGPSAAVVGEEGLFARRDIPKAGEYVSFYNGMRLSHKVVDGRTWSLNTNTITLDGETVLDVPPEWSQTSTYRAALGHKANHSNDANCEYAEYFHPRFGRIMAIKTLRGVVKDEELMCDYGYFHKLPNSDQDDLPPWF